MKDRIEIRHFTRSAIYHCYLENGIPRKKKIADVFNNDNLAYEIRATIDRYMSKKI